MTSRRAAEADALLLRIARCAELDTARTDSAYPCAKVARAQQPLVPGRWQVPEPWNGDLAGAPLLFVSSNPSYDPKEEFPTAASEDIEIVDFFRNRSRSGSTVACDRSEWTARRKRMCGSWSRYGPSHAI